MLVGEIRDAESAEIAVRAALTGHLLFATLHTVNAPLAITRLVDMGLAPYKVLASLAGVAAQRLMRRLCARCKAPGDDGFRPVGFVARHADYEAPGLEWSRPPQPAHRVRRLRARHQLQVKRSDNP